MDHSILILFFTVLFSFFLFLFLAHHFHVLLGLVVDEFGVFREHEHHANRENTRKNQYESIHETTSKIIFLLL